jgi:hypothetical protein
MRRRNFKKLGLSEEDLIIFKNLLSGRQCLISMSFQGKKSKSVFKFNSGIAGTADVNFSFEDAKEWCEENIKGFWSMNRRNKASDWNYVFSEEQDAVMFKLRFG